jgi:transcription initiation factor TFIIIB Brf1 subunit/transcription initiation factor TFIIB
MLSRCRSCGSEDIVINESEGDTICRGCGLVIGLQLLDSRGSYMGQGSSVEVTWSSSNKKLSRTEQQLMARICDENRPSKRHSAAINTVHQLQSALSLAQDIVDAAITLLESLQASQKWVKAGPMLAAAVVYQICREKRAPRTFEELATTTRLNKVDIGRAFAALRKAQEGGADESASFPIDLRKAPLAAPVKVKLDEGADDDGDPNRHRLPQALSGTGAADVAGDVALASVEGGGDLGGASKRARVSSGEDEPSGEGLDGLPPWCPHQPSPVSVASSGQPPTPPLPDAAAPPPNAAAASSPFAAAAVADADLSLVMVLPQQLIPRFSALLKLPPELRHLATGIAQRLSSVSVLAGAAPQVQAAVALALALVLFPRCAATKEAIAAAAQVSTNTLARSYQRACPHWAAVLPPDIQLKLGAETLAELFCA